MRTEVFKAVWQKTNSDSHSELGIVVEVGPQSVCCFSGEASTEHRNAVGKYALFAAKRIQ
jgi:hypothetical protein